MDAEREERIRNRAYAMWEQEGRPEGRQEQHWEQSCRDCDAEDGLIAGPTPVVGSRLGDGFDPDAMPVIDEGAKPGRRKSADALNM